MHSARLTTMIVYMMSAHACTVGGRCDWWPVAGVHAVLAEVVSTVDLFVVCECSCLKMLFPG